MLLIVFLGAVVVPSFTPTNTTRTPQALPRQVIRTAPSVLDLDVAYNERAAADCRASGRVVVVQIDSPDTRQPAACVALDALEPLATHP